MRIFGNNELAIRLRFGVGGTGHLPADIQLLQTPARVSPDGTVQRAGASDIAGNTRLHGTRTGDYDALLTLFTTAYCFSYFSFLEDERPKYLYATFIFLLLAVMTSVWPHARATRLPTDTLWLRKLRMVMQQAFLHRACHIRDSRSRLLFIPAAS